MEGKLTEISQKIRIIVDFSSLQIGSFLLLLSSHTHYGTQDFKTSSTSQSVQRSSPPPVLFRLIASRPTLTHSHGSVAYRSDGVDWPFEWPLSHHLHLRLLSSFFSRQLPAPCIKATKPNKQTRGASIEKGGVSST
jgi:hypothetical protein